MSTSVALNLQSETNPPTSTTTSSSSSTSRSPRNLESSTTTADSTVAMRNLFASQADPSTGLPKDTVIKVLAYLDYKDLAHMACTSKLMREDSESDLLWAPLVQRLWDGKPPSMFPKGKLFPRAEYTEQGLKTLNVSELKYILKECGVDTSPFREKKEFLECVRKYCFALKLPTSVRMPKPQNGKWKAAFAFSLFDSIRKDFTNPEVSRHDWLFYFKRQRGFHSIAKFKADYEFIMDPWPMPTPANAMRWRRDRNDSVMVEHFPNHRATRLQDWRWKLENEHVAFIQMFPGENVDELLDRFHPNHDPVDTDMETEEEDSD